MVIDVHAHAFPDRIADRALDALCETSGEYRPFIGGTIADLVTSMDEAGIDKALVANIATKPEQLRSILAWSSEIASDRLVPLGSVHPDSLSWEQDINAVADAGLRGVKLHPMYQRFIVDEPKMYPFYEKIAERNLFVLFHAGFDIAFPGDESAAPERFLRIRKDIPGLVMIAAHFGGWRMWDRVLASIAGTDIYFDTSFIHELEPGILGAFLARHDRDRFLFATDSPWTQQKKSVERIEALPIDDDFRKKILSGNAIELMRRG
jgi:predicted TIM-barrel fold metal-dependent hydrolase